MFSLVYLRLRMLTPIDFLIFVSFSESSGFIYLVLIELLPNNPKFPNFHYIWFKIIYNLWKSYKVVVSFSLFLKEKQVLMLNVWKIWKELFHVKFSMAYKCTCTPVFFYFFLLCQLLCSYTINLKQSFETE